MIKFNLGGLLGAATLKTLFKGQSNFVESDVLEDMGVAQPPQPVKTPYTVSRNMDQASKIKGEAPFIPDYARDAVSYGDNYLDRTQYKDYPSAPEMDF